jgi:plastocyanin
MKQNTPYLFITALMCLFAVSYTGIADDTSVIVQVFDQSGNPVPEAVVTLTSDDILPALDNLPKAVMAQRNITFEPHILAIPKGTEVWFPNEDDFRHHIYSFSKAKQFEIRLYGGDEEKWITFDTAGIIALGCNIHDSMLAYIYVADTPYVKKTDKNGQVEFSSVIPSEYSAMVWHPLMKDDGSNTETLITVLAGETIKKD